MMDGSVLGILRFVALVCTVACSLALHASHAFADDASTLEQARRWSASASVAYHAGNFQEAARLLELSLGAVQARLGQEHPDTLTLMNNLAGAYCALGQLDKALALHEQTLALSRAILGEEHPDTLTSMNNLAEGHSALGQFDKALALQEQTLKLRRAKLGEEHPDTLASMNNLAAMHVHLGQFDKALVLHEQTRALSRTQRGEDHPHTLASMNNLAETYRVLGQFDKAMALQEQTLARSRSSLGEAHPGTLVSMNNLAETYYALGQFDQALALHEQTLARSRTSLGEEHPRTLVSMNNLANTYRAFGQFEKALALQEQTLKLRVARLGEDHPDTLLAMSNLAAIHVHLGQFDKALALVPGIRAGTEKLRTQPKLSTEQRQSVFARYSDYYQRYASWYAQMQRFVEAFDLGDLSKARTLGDSIKTQAALRSLPEAEQQLLQASEARVKAAQLQLDQLAAAPQSDPQALLALQKRLDTESTAYQTQVADLGQRFPKYAQLTTLRPAGANQAAQLLDPDTAFVSLLVDSKGAAQAFVLTTDGPPQWVNLGTIPHLASTVAAYREVNSQVAPVGRLIEHEGGGYYWLQPGQGKTPPGDGDAREAAQQARAILDRYWYTKLIQPLLPLTRSYRHWVISPDKDLALLPFDVLPESDPGQAKAQRLADTRQLTLVQSFSVYALLQQRAVDYARITRPKELLAMGNAVYGAGWDEGQGIVRGSVRGFVRQASETREDAVPVKENAENSTLRQLRWLNLPGTAREIAAVGAVFENPAALRTPRVDRYLGFDASEGKLLQLNHSGALKDYHYLLFSAHGYLAQNPALSSLVLSQQNNPPDVDGYVTAEEWPLYDVKSDLTVLSACDTGVGKTQAGESVMGLPYALFVAGNKNTILSLWPVDDDATAEFMRRFFSKLKAGMAQPEALTQTKREFSRHPAWNHPSYWAAFVLYGV